MTNFKISPNITLGPVNLTVKNLDRSLVFYQQVIGFHLHQQNDNTASLGTKSTPLLSLVANSQAQRYPNTTGLYHFAILVPDRVALSMALHRIAKNKAQVQGFADHGVSEAIYLADPDGNGIEIYRDRPRSEWPFEGDQLKMVTDPLDVEALYSETDEATDNASLPNGTKIGHMHLYVRDIPEAEDFYHRVLGFNLIQRYGTSAAFLAAGDYHHHIGINTWAGLGASAPPQGSIGLRYFGLQLNSQLELEQFNEHLEQSRVHITQKNGSIFISDPSQNQIEVSFKA